MQYMRTPLRIVLLWGVVSLACGQFAKAAGAPAASLTDGPAEQRQPPHPEPRVIVNVLSVRGPHNPVRVQHDARFGWKRVVRCYKASGAKEKVALTLELALSSKGTVTSVRGILFEEQDSELVSCLIRGLPGLAMPKAPADSKAEVELLLSPGDRPSKNAQATRRPEERVEDVPFVAQPHSCGQMSLRGSQPDRCLPWGCPGAFISSHEARVCP